MAARKILFHISVFMITSLCLAQQRPILTGGFDYFRDKSYDSNSYGNFNLGFQVYQWKFLAPEIGFNYYFGNLRDAERINPVEPEAKSLYKSDGRFGAPVFSIAPKLIFGNAEAALIFVPQYNVGTITTRGDFSIATKNSYALTEQSRYKENISFWSFAAGIQGKFYDSETLFFSLFLKYTLLNSENAFENLETPTQYPKVAKGNADGIGIGAKIYFDFIRLLNKSN